MTYPINYLNPQNPSNYSGVTINITNPAVNTTPQIPQIQQHVCTPYCNHNGLNATQRHHLLTEQTPAIQQVALSQPTEIGAYHPQAQSQQLSTVTAYPSGYYMNNYNNNYANPPYSNDYLENNNIELGQKHISSNIAQNEIGSKSEAKSDFAENEPDLSTSQELINKIDEGIAQQKGDEKNKANSKAVELTNEYIMSLEEYLNNPDYEIRANAAKEILTRLDEDRNRYDDVALNALLNKMLQDPNSTIRSAAMSAFSSGLACGNDYTVKLITDIQNNPKSNKADVIEASNILLRMSREALPDENLNIENQNQEIGEIK